MMPLEHPDSFYVSSAHGWLELGNSTEATAELQRISSAVREHPEVLEVRWQIAVKAKDWNDGLTIAERICHLDPANPFGWIHRSYCLHELKRTQEAWDCLLPKAELFPREWIIRYNLACYACQLGRFPEANEWLMRAIEIGDALRINRMAAEDPDLRPLFQRPSC